MYTFINEGISHTLDRNYFSRKKMFIKAECLILGNEDMQNIISQIEHTGLFRDNKIYSNFIS